MDLDARVEAWTSLQLIPGLSIRALFTLLKAFGGPVELRAASRESLTRFVPVDLAKAIRRESGLAVISAMHDLSLAAQYADRLVLLVAGRVVAEGSAGEVLKEELISAHYAAQVRVVHQDGGVYVLPRRREGTWVR